MSKIFISLFVFIVIHLNLAGQYDTSMFRPKLSPDRIMLTIPGNPSTTRAVSWRTDFTIKNAYAQIIEATEKPLFDSIANTIEAQSSSWETGSDLAMGHRVIFSGLKPSALYNYRVGGDGGWSEWFQFRTSSAENKSFSILYFGDVQNDILSYGSRNLRQAFMHEPDAEFMLFAGDLVNRSYEEYWAEFFYAGSFMFSSIPVVATPGNHEYYPNPDSTKPREFSNHWNQIFTNPQNGPQANLNRSYYFDYQGVKFISLDSYFLAYISQDTASYLQWFEQVLKENTMKWKVVFFHHPVYSCSFNRDNTGLREMIKPILEKYGVDLVLQGHDHTYCRGQNLPMAGTEYENLPVYVVSVSGAKMYGLNPERWSDRVGSNMQLYQVIEFAGDKIIFNSYTSSKELYDSFSIIKNKKGSNTVLNLENNNEEQVEIPGKFKYKYTPEALQKFNATFGTE
ncbi:MAG: metallophosphoesterase [Bacteroidales bacterium]|nr:metallophosphoesterase [Bacteroidales bacterium]MBN2819483.1 metallophosphoesterase [Bacteroidales bacterium]